MPSWALPPSRCWVPLTCSPGDCTEADLSGDQVTLASDDGRAFVLGAVVFTQQNIASANASESSSGWVVDVSLDTAGTQALTTATRAALASSPPANQIAVVLDGRVIEAVTAVNAITSGRVEIAELTEEQAQSLAGTP